MKYTFDKAQSDSRIRIANIAKSINHVLNTSEKSLIGHLNKEDFSKINLLSGLLNKELELYYFGKTENDIREYRNFVLERYFKGNKYLRTFNMIYFCFVNIDRHS